MFLSLRATR
uniref:Uncharacterized protein n=1 Tax=Anguilla anguilla TaxID=7936 RepID=A0A0E9U4U3_ANGAN